MKRLLCLVALLIASSTSHARADDRGDIVDGRADTVADAVRVTILRMGGVDRVGAVEGGGGSSGGCTWSTLPAEVLGPGDHLVVPTGPGPQERAMLYALLCDGSLHAFVWVAPDDVVDLDALARREAQRYVEDVLVPDVAIGVNPAPKGLVGVPSWFWVEGFGGSLQAPPISALGMTIDVRMSSGEVTWDFGDGTVGAGDLGRPYPQESTVQHVHQRDGSFTITATIELAPEYRVNGGPWLPLPALRATASTDHPVEQRQAVISDI